MTITLLPATDADYAIVQNLSAYYLHDMSEFMGWPCPESGRFAGCDEFFEDWRAGRNHPYLLRVDGELAGFAGVKLGPDGETHEIQEFFLLRKFRHQGVGQQVAAQLFARFPGPWRVEALIVNVPAVRFWQSVVTAQGESVTTEVADSPWGKRQVFRFNYE